MKHTPQKTLSKWILGILLISGILLSGVFFAADVVTNIFRPVVGTGGLEHNLGQFYDDYGNHGKLLFGAVPSGASGAVLFVDNNQSPPKQVLTGSFWSQTIGWIQFMDVEFIPHPTLPGESFDGIFSLSGYAWNDQAGWIDFSTVEFDSTVTSFSGYAWNNGIGWLDMNDASLDLTSRGLQGWVKIIGNLGGGSSYDTNYMLSNNASKISASTYINSIRKNVSLLTRNVPNSDLNTALNPSRAFRTNKILGKTAIYKNIQSNATEFARLNYSMIQSQFETTNVNTDTSSIDSVIVIGADVYIDTAINERDPNHRNTRPKVIIVLKDELNRGGNIYIDGSVNRIYSSLVAEGSLYSGRWDGTQGQFVLYATEPSQLWSIPNTQMHIYGSIISNNTIGGFFPDDRRNICPALVDVCLDNYGLRYDFNYFRNFDSEDPNATQGYPTDAYDDFSFIIEYNPRILSDPPPGLATQN